MSSYAGANTADIQNDMRRQTKRKQQKGTGSVQASELDRDTIRELERAAKHYDRKPWVDLHALLSPLDSADGIKVCDGMSQGGVHFFVKINTIKGKFVLPITDPNHPCAEVVVDEGKIGPPEALVGIVNLYGFKGLVEGSRIHERATGKVWFVQVNVLREDGSIRVFVKPYEEGDGERRLRDPAEFRPASPEAIAALNKPAVNAKVLNDEPVTSNDEGHEVLTPESVTEET